VVGEEPGDLGAATDTEKTTVTMAADLNNTLTANTILQPSDTHH
jgi:hypothetical protein